MSARRVDQDMAAAAAGMLRPAAELSPAEQKALRTRYRQLRIMLHSAGLAATYAFVASKSGSGALGSAYAEAARGIRDRLAALHLLTGDPATLDAREVLRQLGAEMDGMKYMRASAEVTSLMGWLSRLADACYESGQAEDSTRDDEPVSP